MLINKRLAYAAIVLLASTGMATQSLAAPCPGNDNALGVSRVIAVDPKEHTRIGTMQYQETLPLADHEVVITFDDGPIPKYTNRILETLATECVKATFLMVGEMAKAHPDDVRRVFSEGHTIGTHSYSHPFTFRRMNEQQAGKEIDAGIEAVQNALGDPEELAPFFRVPGFLTAKPTEAAAVWSSHARKNFDTLTEQSKQLTALAQRVITCATEPFAQSLAQTVQRRS